MPEIDILRREARLAHGRLSWLEAGARDAPTLVLLHGIGSCAASWRAVLTQFADGRRVLAWDAPGYGASDPLPMDRPRAADYAAAAAAWFATAGVSPAVVLGHSLGSLIAAALAARKGAPVSSLILVSPAQGYGRATPDERAARATERLDALRRLGLARMAAERSARLCAPHAAPEVLAQVQADMLAITERGYEQASWMLSDEVIDDALAGLKLPVTVVCGELDAVTPPGPAAALARRIGAANHVLAAVGHACYTEDPAAFCALLAERLAVR